MESDSQNLSQVFPFLACSFSFCCCTFLDFGVESLGLPGPSVPAGRIREKHDCFKPYAYSPCDQTFSTERTEFQFHFRISQLEEPGPGSQLPVVRGALGLLLCSIFVKVNEQVLRACQVTHRVPKCLLCQEFFLKTKASVQMSSIIMILQSMEYPIIQPNLVWSSDPRTIRTMRR